MAKHMSLGVMKYPRNLARPKLGKQVIARLVLVNDIASTMSFLDVNLECLLVHIAVRNEELSR